MRLIDADKLYDWLRTECNPYGKPTIDFDSGNRMLDIINRMSTAFDKEKVIEELRNEIHLTVYDPMISGRYIKKERALEIVEKGGIE